MQLSRNQEIYAQRQATGFRHDVIAGTVRIIADLNDVLHKRLIPREERDDTKLHPGMARLIGSDDPRGAISRSHCEISTHCAPILGVELVAPLRGTNLQATRGSSLPVSRAILPSTGCQ